jgi:hypothetical protein
MAERPVVYRVGRSANHTVNHTALAGQVAEYLQLRGAWVLRVRGGLGQRRGVPDVLACFPERRWIPHTRGEFIDQGIFVAAEVKTGRGRLTRDQERERDALRKAGGVWVEVRRLDDLETALLEAGLITSRVLWPRQEG